MGLFNELDQVVTEHLERRTKQNELFYSIKEKIKKREMYQQLIWKKKKMKKTFDLCACLCIREANPEKLDCSDKVVICLLITFISLILCSRP